MAASGKEISTRPFQFITGRKCTGTACTLRTPLAPDPLVPDQVAAPPPRTELVWRADVACARNGLCAVGGWKTRDAVPMLVEKSLSGEIKLGHFVTHEFNGVGNTTKALEALHSGDCLRAVVHY